MTAEHDLMGLDRHPAFLNRLDSEDYYPISVVKARMLQPGDIIDLRDFSINLPESRAFLLLDEVIKNDLGGVIAFVGTLNDGSPLRIEHESEVAMYRRGVVRYAKRVPI
jgi:hypothetical protein